MKWDPEIDKVLSTAEDDIVPSSGFTQSVMDAIRSEAAAPAPIPFPWVRALPGFAGLIVALGWVLVAALTQVDSRVVPASIAIPVAVLVPAVEAAAWSILGLAGAYVAVKVSILVRAHGRA